MANGLPRMLHCGCSYAPQLRYHTELNEEQASQAYRPQQAMQVIHLEKGRSNKSSDPQRLNSALVYNIEDQPDAYTTGSPLSFYHL